MLYNFWLTITSQIESIRSTQYTPLYKNEQFESRISQWRLLSTICLRWVKRFYALKIPLISYPVSTKLKVSQLAVYNNWEFRVRTGRILKLKVCFSTEACKDSRNRSRCKIYYVQRTQARVWATIYLLLYLFLPNCNLNSCVNPGPQLKV